MVLFNKVFPLRQIVTRKTYHVTWITQSIKKSSKNKRLLNRLRKGMTISESTKQYIDNYNRIYKKVLNEQNEGRMTDLYLKPQINLK
jgi:predicted patatin/cPLA2 family phospholipase